MDRNVNIPDGDNQARISDLDGQRFNLARGNESQVHGAPVVNIVNDDVRVGIAGTASTTGDTATIRVAGDNARVSVSGSVTSEAVGVLVENDASADIRNSGRIEGDVDAVSFANGGTSTGSLDSSGVIASDSRAVNIGGADIEVVNRGEIIGTGDQRNGTIYSDGSAEDYNIRNTRQGTIDAGEGNQGAGIALQTGDHAGDVVQAEVINRGTVQGRGQGDPTTGLAGDGIRVFAGAEDVTYSGDIVNGGTIFSESTQGPVGAVRIANGVNFNGNIENQSNSLIDGAANGVYFGTGQHDASILNSGVIQSDSRAVNIDGTGVDLRNGGMIVGTGDQRNGTVYADGTADDYSINNTRQGVIDAGEGNQGAGIALQTGDVVGDRVEADIVNRGTIDGRGQADPTSGLAGDGLRIFAGAEDVTFAGDIFNGGSIRSESTVGPVSGIRIANGVNFEGEIFNQHGALIDGANNGLYFGTGNHAANVINNGVIQSDSRAVNIDGNGVSIENNGAIVGTGDQRNGTLYADATADNYSILNNGRIDAGQGNNGSGISLQTGDVDGDRVTASVTNEGLVRGRGDALTGNRVGDGIRIFSGVEDATFVGDVVNNGNVRASTGSDAAVAVRIEDGTSLEGSIINTGRLAANEIAIDATEAGGSIDVINSGTIIGEVRLSENADRFTSSGGSVDVVTAGAGNDELLLGGGDDTATGGSGDDLIDGGHGFDTAIFLDVGSPIIVDVDDEGNGTVTTEVGFSVTHQDVPVDVLNPETPAASDFVGEALSGNLYFNIHTETFPAGEIRGQLDTVVSDETSGEGVRTIVISGELDASQEPGPTSDSLATGFGNVTITVQPDGEISYSSELDVSGIGSSELLPVAGFSAIHLHNAPAGVNGAVVLDIVQDAGGDINGAALNSAFDTGDGNVFVEEIEVDTLVSVENIVIEDVLQNDGDDFLFANDNPDTTVPAEASPAPDLAGGFSSSGPVGFDVISSDDVSFG